MRPTARGRLAILAAGTLALAGFLLVKPALAAFGFLVAVALLGVGVPFARSLGAVRGALEVLTTTVSQDERILLRATWEAPPGTRVRLAPWSEERARLVEARDEASGALLTLAPGGQGEIAWNALRVVVTDAAGLFEAERAIPIRASVRVHPSRKRLAEARQAATRGETAMGVVTHAAGAGGQYELSTLRDYSPGDRMRDVDWKRSALLDELLTKTYESETPATLLILVDASRSMRRATGEASRLERAGQVALEAAQLALAQGRPVGLLAFDETRVLGEVAARASPRQLALVSEALAALPRREAYAQRPDVALVGEAASDAFLARAASVRGATLPLGRPLLDVLARATSSHPPGQLTVLALTDFETHPAATLQALLALRARRHDVVCGLLRSAPHGAPPPRSVREAEDAYRELAAQRAARGMLVARGARLVDLTPDAPVAAWASRRPSRVK